MDVARRHARAIEGADDLEQRRARSHGHGHHGTVGIARGRAVGEGRQRRLACGEVLRRHDGHVDALTAHSQLELGRGARGHHAAVVEQDDVIGQVVGFVEVLSGQQQGHPIAHELLEEVPELDAAGRIQTGGGLVEEQHRWRGHQRGGQVEAAAHSSGEGLHQAVGVVGKAQPLEQLVGARSRHRAGQVIEAPHELEVRAGGEQAVDRGGLACQPDPRADGGSIGHDVEAVDPRAARAGLGERGEDAHRRGLAGAVVAEQSEDGTGRHVEIQVAQRPEVAIALAEAVGDDSRRGVVRTLYAFFVHRTINLVVRCTYVKGQ